MATDVLSKYTDVATERIRGENGIEYAYRDLGAGDVPLVLLQHFRGNLDKLGSSACRRVGLGSARRRL
jgi:hypothetical protein